MIYTLINQSKMSLVHDKTINLILPLIFQELI